MSDKYIANVITTYVFPRTNKIVKVIQNKPNALRKVYINNKYHSENVTALGLEQIIELHERLENNYGK